MNREAATRRRRISKWHSRFVLISCCLPTILHIGFLFSIGTLFTDVMAAFNSTRVETAVIQSTSIGVWLCSGIFTGALFTKISLTTAGILGTVLVSLGLMVCFFASSLTYLIIAMGVLCGFGFSCVYISSATAVSKHFSGRKQLLYLSIQASGAGIGGMVYPYVMRYLSDLYGFRGSLLIIGAISMNAVPGCILWKQHSYTSNSPAHLVSANQIGEFQTRFQVKTEDSGEYITIEKLRHTSSAGVSDSVYISQYPVLPGGMKTKTVIIQRSITGSSSLNKTNEDQTLCKTIKQLLCNKTFMLFVFGSIISIPPLNVIFIFVADIYLDNGLNNNDVSMGLFLINVMVTIGRLLPGISVQSKRISTLVLPLINAVVSTGLIVSFTFAKSRWLILVLSGAIGIPIGICVSSINVITLKLVGSNRLPIAIGMFFTFEGIGQTIAGPMNGYVRDVTGSYIAIFYTSAAVSLLAAVIFLVAYVTRRRQKQEARRHSSVFYLTSL